MNERALRVQQNRRRGLSYERRVLQRIHALRIPMSGAGQVKGDGKLETPHGSMLLECKYTTTSRVSVAIRLSWLHKLRTEAEKMACPLMGLIFRAAYQHTDYIVIDEQTRRYTMFPVYAAFTAKQGTFRFVYNVTDAAVPARGLARLQFVSYSEVFYIGQALPVVEALLRL